MRIAAGVGETVFVFKVATVAMANKTARIVWAVLTRNEPYSPRTVA